MSFTIANAVAVAYNQKIVDTQFTTQYTDYISCAKTKFIVPKPDGLKAYAHGDLAGANMAPGSCRKRHGLSVFEKEQPTALIFRAARFAISKRAAFFVKKQTD